MSKEEFRRLADLKVPLVRVRRMVEINPGEVESAIAFWEQRRRRGLTVRDAHDVARRGQ